MKRKIVGIPDGDTVKTKVKVRGSNYLRLEGYNTPEKNQRGFQLAKDRLRKNLPKNKVVGVTVVGQDCYGRAVVRLRNGRKSVNNAMKKHY